MKAWESDDRRSAYIEVLRRMVTSREDSTDNAHYAPFLAFIDEVEHQLQTDRVAWSHFPEAVVALLVDLATDTWEGEPEDRDALLRFCGTHPLWGGALAALRAEVEQFLGPGTR